MSSSEQRSAVVYFDELSVPYESRRKFLDVIREATRDADYLNDVIYMSVTKNPREANILITSTRTHAVKDFEGETIIFGEEFVTGNMRGVELRKICAWKLGKKDYKCSLGGGTVSCDPATW